ncbi:hypothetical protein [Pseudomonas sp. PDM22]|uniref:hypothetical protein n=1 Tax=Pseudomonas sp. PDM22 TaxID=2769287 RepID=UPI00178124AC|nr:hypothetical protein [Pseudomonas sp. PDM22]MBD9513663.1 hypothetical protein [Pseudomonas sp. PDM22]
MNASHFLRSLPALMLLGILLINGLICSLGHGNAIACMPSAVSHDHHAHDMSMSMGGQHEHPSPIHAMGSAGGDCLFAGSLPLGFLVFLALGWLMRAPPEPPPSVSSGLLFQARYVLPRVNPQGP